MNKLMQSGYKITKSLADKGLITINNKIGELLLKDKPIKTKQECSVQYLNNKYDATIQSKLQFEGTKKQNKYYHLNCPELKGKMQIGDKIDISINKNTIIFSRNNQSNDTFRSLEESPKKKVYRRISPKLSKNEKEQNFFENKYKDYERNKIIEELSNIKETDSKKILFEGSRYKRDNKTIALLKKLRNFECQICGTKIKKRDGSFYIEGAHIIGKNEKGSETPDNILILCPNCHKEFDHGKKKIISHSKDSVSFKLNGKKHNISLKLE